MGWIKHGQIYKATNKCELLLSHASNPLPTHIEGDIFRVYYNGRDTHNRSSIGYVDVNIVLRKVVNNNFNAVARYGPIESFFSDGVSLGNIYQIGSNKYILFMGWKLKEHGEWEGNIGRFLVRENLDLDIDSFYPILSTDKEDPFSLSYPFVIYDQGTYKMWYGSTLKWKSDNGEMIHVIKFAESKDGIKWKKKGIAIPYEIGVAQAFSRPSIIVNEGYHMWFSFRGDYNSKYRIGYAYSIDSINWVVANEIAGMNVSEKGWDSEMVCYPHVFSHKNHYYMLYNGNNYGKEGFGIAEWI